MISIISASARKNNKTIAFAKAYQQVLKSLGKESVLFSLEKLPLDYILENWYDYEQSKIQKVIDDVIVKNEKIVVLLPEYNGTFPGVLKLFIDSIHPKYFKNKKIALVGISSGRAGNVVGMNQITTVFNHVNAFVLPNKLPISKIDDLFDIKKRKIDDDTVKLIEQQAKQLIEW